MKHSWLSKNAPSHAPGDPSFDNRDRQFDLSSWLNAARPLWGIKMLPHGILPPTSPCGIPEMY